MGVEVTLSNLGGETVTVLVNHYYEQVGFTLWGWVGISYVSNDLSLRSRRGSHSYARVSAV